MVKKREVPPEAIEYWQNKIDEIESDIADILKQEYEEKEVRIAEMEANRVANLIEHEGEISSRPKRTWFQTEKEKKQLKEKSKEDAERKSLRESDDEGGSNEDNSKESKKGKKDKKDKNDKRDKRDKKDKKELSRKKRRKLEAEKDPKISDKEVKLAVRTSKKQERLQKQGVIPKANKKDNTIKKKTKQNKSFGTGSSGKNFDSEMKDSSGTFLGKKKSRKSFKSKSKFKRR